MEDVPTPPEGALICLFCKGTIALPQGDGEKYKDHLRREHSVYYNNEWLLQQTLASQLPELFGQKGVETQKQGSCAKATQTEKETPKERIILSEHPDDDGEKTEEDLHNLEKPEQRVPMKRVASETNSSPGKKLKIDYPDFTGTEVEDVHSGRNNKADLRVTQDEKDVLSDRIGSADLNGTEVKDVLSDEQLVAIINNMSVKTVSLDVKKLNLSRINERFTEKIFGNNYAFSCKTRCKMCHKLCSYRAFHLHTKAAHQMSFKTYKLKFGEKIIKREVTVYHKCKICGEDLLLDKVEIKQHLVQHGSKMSTYNYKYMEYSEKRPGSLDKPGRRGTGGRLGRKAYVRMSKEEGWMSNDSTSDKESTGETDIGADAEPAWDDDTYCPDIESDGGSNYCPDFGNAENGHVLEHVGTEDLQDVSNLGPKNIDNADLVRNLKSAEGVSKDEMEQSAEHMSKDIHEVNDQDLIFKPKHTSSKKEDKNRTSRHKAQHLAKADSIKISSKIVESSPERRRSRRVKGNDDADKEEGKNGSKTNSTIKKDGKAELKAVTELRRKGKFNRLVSESSDMESPSWSSKGNSKSNKQEIKPAIVRGRPPKIKSDVTRRDRHWSPSKPAKKSKKQEDKPSVVEGLLAQTAKKSNKLEDRPDAAEELLAQTAKKSSKVEDKPDVVEGLLALTKSGTGKKNRPCFRNGKFFSDNFEDCCKIRCKICMKILKIPQLRMHTRDDHEMSVTAYKEKYGSEYEFVNEVYHKCQICGMKLLLCPDNIASHVKIHKMSSKEYNDKYMIKCYEKSEGQKYKLTKTLNDSKGIIDNESFMKKIAKEASTSSKTTKSKVGLSWFGTRRKKHSHLDKTTNKKSFKDTTSKNKDSSSRTRLKSDKDSSSRTKPKSDPPKVIKITKKSDDAVDDPAENYSAEDESDTSLLEESPSWYDGNNFECLKCQFTAMSQKRFANHVKKNHGTTLVKFKGSYKQTKKMYECKFCTEEINHEKTEIKNHVDAHFLTLEKYAQLYERDCLEKQKLRKTKSDQEHPGINKTSEVGITNNRLTMDNIDSEVICPPLQMDNIDLVEGGSWMSFSENNPLLEDILDEHNLPREEREIEHCDNRDTIGSPLSQLDQIPINQLVSAETELLSDNSRPVSPASDEDDDGSVSTRAVNLSSGLEASISVSAPQDVVASKSDEMKTYTDTKQLEDPEEDPVAIETHSEEQESEKSNKFPLILKMVNETISEESIDLSPFAKANPTDVNEDKSPSIRSSTETLQKGSSAEQSLYLCPFEGCKFQTDLEGMRSGPAARHGMEAHNTQPWEIKKHGLKFKRVSVEKHLETLFADT